MGFIQRRLRHAVLHVVAHPKITLLIAGAILAASVGLALARLRISSDENKLFSQKVKFFREFLEFDDKFPENDALYVVIEQGDPSQSIPVSRWTELADAITSRLQAMPQVVEAVDSHIPAEKMGPQGVLFDEPAKVRENFAEFKEFSELIKFWAEKPNAPLTAVLGSTPTERFLSGLSIKLFASAPREGMIPFIGLLADSWLTALKHPDQPLQIGQGLPDVASLDAEDPSRLGYYYVPDESDPTRSKHMLLVSVYPRVNYSSMTAISQTIETIRAAIADASRPFPEFTVGTSGRPAVAADEMSTTDRDSNRAEIVALTIVFIVMAFMLRSIWLALAAEIALAVGIGWTFGWATLTLGELNLLSLVFLIALIGIGMDYLVQILAAYRREARRRVRAQAIWARVFRSVGAPINTACMGAAGAFLVAAFTDFRGAADLGIIAGGGPASLPALRIHRAARDAGDLPPEAENDRGHQALHRPGGKRHRLAPVYSAHLGRRAARRPSLRDANKVQPQSPGTPGPGSALRKTDPKTQDLVGRCIVPGFESASRGKAGRRGLSLGRRHREPSGRA